MSHSDMPEHSTGISMKILHIGAGNLYGGIEKVMLTLARRRAETSRVQQHFAVCFEGRFEQELRNSGSAVHNLKPMSGSKPLSVLANKRRLSKILRDTRYDVVVYHSLWSYDLLAVPSRRSGVVTALWMHDAFSGGGAFEAVARLRRPDVLLSNSLFTAATAVRVYPNIRPKIVYYPIDNVLPGISCDERVLLRRSLQTREEDVVIIQCSRMEAWKGHVLHLEALARLRSTPGWVLWVAGAAQREQERLYVQELRSQAQALGIADRVRFLGHRDDLASVLRCADIHCQPNASPEPFGLVFVEAMMAGLPNVTFRFGSAPELIGEDCGLLSSPGDIDALSSDLSLLIRDQGLRSKLGANGPKRAREISDPDLRFEELLSSLQAGRKCG
jgi:glycosyltransferase involved in cell wall biosynthesis